MIRFNRLFKSFVYAIRGLRKVFREEQNLRIQAVVALFVGVLAWRLGVSRTEWAILILAAGAVALMEIVNTVVELTADILKPRINEYAKTIKDIMAAAVMMASIAAVIVGIIVFWPYLF